MMTSPFERRQWQVVCRHKDGKPPGRRGVIERKAIMPLHMLPGFVGDGEDVVYIFAVPASGLQF
ncbi:hypothetical protein RB623_24250 [Mesorhizobium sp. LHD-90]|uniref:hypothetical protein n=1 Tax=Mesorhizobium sp. LHD-90 TaxID=3071414 RepID=UPI0027E02057|nr:hypothetical protein [Mesorhizobium sp. LHD-90]MDQ6437177.1 hypothetical protein [Mesorhizobium sp. LHD-90]